MTSRFNRTCRYFIQSLGNDEDPVHLLDLIREELDSDPEPEDEKGWRIFEEPMTVNICVSVNASIDMKL